MPNLKGLDYLKEMGTESEDGVTNPVLPRGKSRKIILS